MPHAGDAQDAPQSRHAGADENDKDASTFQLKPTYAVGFRACGRNVVDFLSESVVVYPAAHHVVLVNTETNTMEFLHHTRSVRSVQCFALSPNRELLAVAEIHHTNASSLPQGAAAAVPPSPAKTASSLAISAAHLHEQHQQHVLCIYKTASRSRVRAITLPHNSSIVSCSFSACNKFLALLEDAPTHNVTYWKVSNAKLVASCKCPSRGARIHISPSSASFLSVSGPAVLKYWVWTPTSEFKIGNFLPPLREQDHFADHVWAKEHMVALSEKGALLCFRVAADGASADLVHSYRCHHLSFVRMECITVHAKGFVVGGSAGFFSLYESSDDPRDPFALVRSVSVGDVAFESVAVSPSIETIVVCTKSQELLTFAMSAVDTVQEDRVDYREFARHGYQVGGIVQIDTCVQRPIVASCGADKSVRVWNCELRQYEVLHQCPDEPQALGLHPSGFQVAVAFKERVRVFNVLVESLKQVRELPVKACRAVRYARGGHVFACAAGLTVLVFRSYTFDLVHTFSGHIGAVRCLAWSSDDAVLVSAAHDGAVYRWSLATGGRADGEAQQHVAKQCQYTALVVDERDPKVAVAAGSDGKVRELVGGEEATVVDLAPGVCVTALALAKDGRRLFAGTNVGSLLVYAWPLSAKSVVESFAHAGAVSHVSVTEDNESVVSSSEDGAICVFRVGRSGAAGESTASPSSSDAPAESSSSTATLSTELLKQQEKKRALAAFADAVLVARDDLEERHAALAALRQHFEQVQADVEFALHRKENEWVERLRLVKEECEALVVQERVRYEELEARHQLAARKHGEELAHKAASHATLTQELENQYERKLAQEVARFDALAETLEQTRQRCAALLETQDVQHRGALHGERKAAYARTKEQNDVIRRLHDDLAYNHVKFEEVLQQEESEYEQELRTLRAAYEAQLAAERQNTAVKQGQVSATATKLEALKKKLQELKAASHARDVLFATERAKLAKLEATLAHYEQHFETCALALADKDRALQGLASSNRVLESFRSVLHHRVDGLEAAKAPMQQHVRVLETHIAEMQTELCDEFKAKAASAKDGESKDAKIKMLLQEVKMLRQSTRQKEYAASEMTRELTRLAQITNLKDMEAAVKDAYKTLVIGEHVHKKPPRALLGPPAGADESRSAADSSSSPAKRGSGGGRASTAPSPSKGSSKASNRVGDQPQQTRGSTNSSSSSATDEALGYDCKQAVDESVKQVEYMSRTIQTLRNALENTKLKADRIRRDSVAEGSALIDECNKLRKENKRLLFKVRELEQVVGSSSSGGGLRSPPPLSTGATAKALQASVSSPEIRTPEQLAPESEAVPESRGGSSTPTAKLLLPLSTTPLSKQQQQQHRRKQTGNSPLPTSTNPSPSSSLSSRHGGNGNNMLPFARLELEREKRSGRSPKADDMAQLVERQRKEIQRLQSQVQLLLADEGSSEPPNNSSNNITAREPQLGSLQHPRDVPHSADFVARTSSASTSRHVSALRPIHVHVASNPLHSSFVLTPGEQQQHQHQQQQVLPRGARGTGTGTSSPQQQLKEVGYDDDG